MHREDILSHFLRLLRNQLSKATTQDDQRTRARMAARTSATTTIRALEWTRRRIIPSASIQSTSTPDQFPRTTSTVHKAVLSTCTAPRQAQKHILPGSIPKQLSPTTTTTDTFPIAQPLEQTLDRRLRFLSKTRPTFTSKYRTTQISTSSAATTTTFFDRSEKTPPSNTTATAEQQRHHRRKPKRSAWKSYTPGFRQGDFICPQCGTHNFRPPEHTQAIIQQSTIVPRAKKHDRFSPTDQQQEHEGIPGESASGGGSHRQQQPLLQQQQRLTRFQREVIPPQRKYPQGAAGHCFECGFQTSFTIPSSSPAATSHSHQQGDKNSTIDKDGQHTDTHLPTSSPLPSLSSSKYRNDIRLSNPRDYVCPHCQTVNFSNRLHCVGCGTLAPWIHTRVVEQTQRRHPPSKKRSSRSVK